MLPLDEPPSEAPLLPHASTAAHDDAPTMQVFCVSVKPPQVDSQFGGVAPHCLVTAAQTSAHDAEEVWEPPELPELLPVAPVELSSEQAETAEERRRESEKPRAAMRYVRRMATI